MIGVVIILPYIYVLRFFCLHRSLDITNIASSQKAEVLFNELLSKMKDLEDSMHSNVPFDLEKVMDIQRARQEIKVSMSRVKYL